MKTELLYLSDTYLFKETATFLEMREHEKGMAVILDRTIFYPQGGGQPSDSGYIVSASGKFKVNFVGLDAEGVVYHVGTFEEGSFQPGESTSLSIDEEKRKLHARIHSAGHLLDVAISSLGLAITPAKGFHFPDGPYVEYDGTVDNPEELKAVLEERINALIVQNITVEKCVIPEEEAAARGLHAPVGKDVRVVNFAGDKGCGCGGTHVTSSGDIGKVTIRKISSKQGKTRVAYSV